MTSVVIHANDNVPWQKVRGSYFAEGFAKAGIGYEFTDSRVRLDERPAILLGTTFWRAVERAPGPWLLVDRCSFGDTERFVQLVWNGHGRRGDHKVPVNAAGTRWQTYGTPMRPWEKKGKRVVLCGQTETYSPHWNDLDAWYAQAKIATHFRPHPASGVTTVALPLARDFKDTRLVITLNSSIGVQSVLDGVPTVTMDDGAMAWPVTSHSLEDEPMTPARIDWLHWLAWTQWTDDEIREGTPWAYHF